MIVWPLAAGRERGREGGREGRGRMRVTTEFEWKAVRKRRKNIQEEEWYKR